MQTPGKNAWIVIVVGAMVAVPAVAKSFAAMRDALILDARGSDSLVVGEQGGDAQQAAVTPNKVEFENDQIKVIRGFLAPHQKTAVHSHPYRFGVTLTKNDLMITSDGKTAPSKKNAQEILCLQKLL